MLPRLQTRARVHAYTCMNVLYVGSTAKRTAWRRKRRNGNGQHIHAGNPNPHPLEVGVRDGLERGVVKRLQLVHALRPSHRVVQVEHKVLAVHSNKFIVYNARQDDN